MRRWNRPRRRGTAASLAGAALLVAGCRTGADYCCHPSPQPLPFFLAERASAPPWPAAGRTTVPPPPAAPLPLPPAPEPEEPSPVKEQRPTKKVEGGFALRPTPAKDVDLPGRANSTQPPRGSIELASAERRVADEDEWEPNDLPAMDDAPADNLNHAPADAELAQGVTLGQVIGETLMNDPAIRVADEDVRVVAGGWIAASLPPNPTVSSVITLLPLERWEPEEREGGPPQYDLFVSYPIDWWLFGKREAAMEASRLEITVAGAEVANTARERVAEAVATYFEVLEAKALVALAELDVENMERVEEATARLVELEAAGRIELDRVRLEVLASRRELRDAHVALASARARLRALMGRLGPDPNFEVAGDLLVPVPAAPPTTETVLAIASESRPDLIARRRAIQQAAAQIRSARVEGYPEVAIETGYTRQFQRRAIGQPDANSFGVGVEFTVPLYDRNQGAICEAEARYRQAQREYQANLLEIQAEIEEAAEAYRQAYGIVTVEAPAQFEAATRVREAFEQAYAEGGRSFLEVLDAQRAFRETNRLYIQGLAQYWQSLYRLNATAGRLVIE